MTNVDFWCRVMGMRFVKNTLNFETTFRYHTYFGDEEGHPGSVVTFLEFTEATPPTRPTPRCSVSTRRSPTASSSTTPRATRSS
jgi:catechol 2,3-dioxygenase-like lactoylglutathione lyase family enzyme